MMQAIEVLSPELQNQIAAGEVVERPSSVLKELVENSLDAGATRIQAVIEGGGQSLVQVEDNGLGMSPHDLPRAMTRHATSKISSFQDLLRIASFGFRGEALPSIGSVSRMHIRSIQSGQTEGAQLEVDFGVLSEVKPIPFREGTSIQVRDLFANTPARLKFLKTQPTEAKRCQEAVARFALANPATSFVFTSNERTVLDFPAGQSVLQRLHSLWPPGITEKLLEVEAKDGDYALSGYIGHPEAAQGRGDRIVFFVNQRPVQDKMLVSALRQAFKGRLLHKEYPQAALFLEVPGSEVDVNVHPAKLEVRFRDEKRLFTLLHHGLTAALAKTAFGREEQSTPASCSGSSPSRETKYTLSTFEEFVQPRAAEVPSQWDQKAHWSQIQTDQAERTHFESSMEPGEPAQQPPPSVISIQGLTYLGQVHNTYLLLATADGELRVIDQHAAHERILYHRFSTQSQQGTRRPLGIPISRTLHPSEEDQLGRSAPVLRRLGFELDRSQAGTVLIRAVPAHLDPSRAREFLDQVLKEQAESQEKLWQVMACRQAVKAGEILSGQEAMELIQLWLSTPDKEYCPHGRPAIVALGAKELERMFKRRG
ncbi:MAG: DNA mismatch repair endonuclease MutL [Desulfovermiculus sp.]